MALVTTLGFIVLIKALMHNLKVFKLVVNLESAENCKFQMLQPWQNGKYTAQKSNEPKFRCPHGMLNNPEWILKAKACYAKSIVDEGEQKI